MDLAANEIDIDDTLAIALQGSSLFEQYNELDLLTQAQEDCYENLYPNVA
ncbi:MAG: hypothetical protein AAF993_14725 [Pseudomonadota bacterium]